MVLDQKIATRQSYGEALAELGEENKNVVVLDADLSGATKTSIFAKEFPERFFDMGIAEQDMMGTGSGLSTFGKIPYVSTFAVFAAGRAYDQIRNSNILAVDVYVANIQTSFLDHLKLHLKPYYSSAQYHDQ